MFCVYKMWMLVRNSSSLASYILTRGSSCDKVVFVRFEVLAVVMIQVQVFLVLLCTHILFLHNVVYPLPPVFLYLPSLVSSFCLWPVHCFFIYVLIFYACRGILCPYVTHSKFAYALHHAKGDGGNVLSQGLQDCGFGTTMISWSPLKT